jgi:hypothetical protein
VGENDAHADGIAARAPVLTDQLARALSEAINTLRRSCILPAGFRALPSRHAPGRRAVHVRPNARQRGATRAIIAAQVSGSTCRPGQSPMINNDIFASRWST